MKNLTFKEVNDLGAKGNKMAFDEMVNRINLAKNNDELMQLEIIDACNKLIHKFAYQFVKISSVSDIDDMVSLGTMAVLMAINDFDAAKGMVFTSYAYMRIQGYVSAQTRVEWINNNVKVFSLEEQVGTCEDGTELKDVIEDEKADTFKDVFSKMQNTYLQDALLKISSNQRKALIGHYVYGYKQKELADMFGVDICVINRRMDAGRIKLKSLLNGVELF